MSELGAAKAAVDGAKIVKVAAFERAGREVALGQLGAMQIAEGEGTAFLLRDVEQRAALEPRHGELAVGKPAGFEPAVLEGAAREIGAADRGQAKEAPLELCLGEVDIIQGKGRRKLDAGQGQIGRAHV